MSCAGLVLQRMWVLCRCPSFVSSICLIQSRQIESALREYLENGCAAAGVQQYSLSSNTTSPRRRKSPRGDTRGRRRGKYDARAKTGESSPCWIALAARVPAVPVAVPVVPVSAACRCWCFMELAELKRDEERFFLKKTHRFMALSDANRTGMDASSVFQR